MYLFIFIGQLIMMFPLYFIMKYLSKKEISLINKILLPSIYMIIVAGFFKSLKPNIFNIPIMASVIYYFTSEYLEDKKDPQELLVLIIQILLSVFIYIEIISKVSNLIPDSKVLLPWIWFLIIIYLYNILSKLNLKKDKKVKIKEKEFNENYYLKSYLKYRKEYAHLLTKDSNFNYLIIAILSYNNYLEPTYKRKIKERITFIPKKRFGIASIKSKTYLNDEDSVQELIKIIKKEMKKEKIKNLNKQNMKKVMKAYNDDENYLNEIEMIRNLFAQFFKN